MERLPATMMRPESPKTLAYFFSYATPRIYTPVDVILALVWLSDIGVETAWSSTLVDHEYLKTNIDALIARRTWRAVTPASPKTLSADLLQNEQCPEMAITKLPSFLHSTLIY